MPVSFELSIKSKEMLKSLPPKLKKGIMSGVKESMKGVEKSVKKQFGSAGSIKNRTGFLMKSIRAGKVHQVSNDIIVSSVGSNAIYAAIHEFGGVITPKAGGYLKFLSDTGWVSVRKVVIPKRPYFAPGVKKAIPSIKRAIDKMVEKELSR